MAYKRKKLSSLVGKTIAKVLIAPNYRGWYLIDTDDNIMCLINFDDIPFDENGMYFENDITEYHRVK